MYLADAVGVETSGARGGPGGDTIEEGSADGSLLQGELPLSEPGSFANARPRLEIPALGILASPFCCLPSCL